MLPHEAPASAPPGHAGAGAGGASAPLMLDACQVGVVLRAVLFVEVCAAVGAGFTTNGLMEWILRLALVSGGTLPATLSWLLVTFLLKRALAHLSEAAQAALAVTLGAVAGLYGCALLAWSGLMPGLAWGSSAAAGALASAVLVAGLSLRAKSQWPAHASARLAELQARIRPHFLFNTLNSAIALVRAEPARAEALLEDLSDLFRQALDASGQPLRLADEIALAQRYLAIEQVRFGARLRVHWSLDPSADEARLPPLLLQPLVENAVHHGVEPSPEGADVHISTQRRGDRVVIKVRNSVPHGAGRAGSGMALRNVRERLALLHDVQAQFRSVHKNDTFLVRMEVPA